ncbi:MAG: cobalamin biosynthesis protein CbiD [Candidatus Melainabacteria bacterium]|nr:MAG: cobalamin biosynthesis protein CbiD [Candidatus Melainabacteria bacterium]
MRAMEAQELDLKKPAENGLRRGWTTGSCATAGVKAAVKLLEDGEIEDRVRVTLPGRQNFLVIPIARIENLGDLGVRAEVVKFAGDDPDNTRGATIVCTVRRNNLGSIRFLAGEGVGTVTEPGIRVAVGEPAINPAPRQMMIQAVHEILDGRVNPGYDLIIGCENGEAIAKRTFNPRLGIVGGISILGTTGIVEPMSLAAYKASIEVYIRVALAAGQTVAFMPGNIGLSFAKNKLSLPQKRIVQIANFVGFALDCAEATLAEEQRELDQLWLLGHPGKLAKILDGVWDTHSSKSAMAIQAIAGVAGEVALNSAQLTQLQEAKTVEAIVEQLGSSEEATRLWLAVEDRLEAIIGTRSRRVKRIYVRLFGMNGTPLGGAR